MFASIETKSSTTVPARSDFPEPSGLDFPGFTRQFVVHKSQELFFKYSKKQISQSVKAQSLMIKEFANSIKVPKYNLDEWIKDLESKEP